MACANCGASLAGDRDERLPELCTLCAEFELERRWWMMWDTR
jgi:hypothetical protein